MAWQASEWPKGQASKVAFVLSKVKGGTRPTFTQTGIRSSQAASLKKGWTEFYWKPLKLLENA